MALCNGNLPVMRGILMECYLSEKLSSSPPQPMNWLENPLTILYSSGFIWKAPPINLGYLILYKA